MSEGQCECPVVRERVYSANVERHIPLSFEIKSICPSKDLLRGCKGKPWSRRHVPLKSAQGLSPGSQEEKDTPAGEWRVEGKDKEDCWDVRQCLSHPVKCVLLGDSSLSSAYVLMHF